MSLLPPQMKNTDFMPLTLGAKVVKPAAWQPVSENDKFRFWNHDKVPFGCSPKPPLGECKFFVGVDPGVDEITEHLFPFKVWRAEQGIQREPIALEDVYVNPLSRKEQTCSGLAAPYGATAKRANTIQGAIAAGAKELEAEITKHLFPEQEAVSREDAVAAKMALIHKAKQELCALARGTGTLLAKSL